MQERRSFILDGHARFWRLFKHPIGADEQVKIAPPIVDVTDAPAEAWPRIIAARKHGDGQLWATNRRAFLDNRGTVLREWSWDSLASVQVIPGYLGVVFTRWLTVEATYAAACGRLDEWYAELPSRNGAVAVNSASATHGDAVISPLVSDGVTGTPTWVSAARSASGWRVATVQRLVRT
jgi:hypothetical protein